MPEAPTVLAPEAPLAPGMSKIKPVPDLEGAGRVGPTAQYRLSRVEGDEPIQPVCYLAPGAYDFQVRYVDPEAPEPMGPWSEPTVIYLSEPTVQLGLAATIPILALLRWWRRR